jgi:hypothetical protein
VVDSWQPCAGWNDRWRVGAAPVFALDREVLYFYYNNSCGSSFYSHKNLQKSDKTYSFSFILPGAGMDLDPSYTLAIGASVTDRFAGASWRKTGWLVGVQLQVIFVVALFSVTLTLPKTGL